MLEWTAAWARMAKRAWHTAEEHGFHSGYSLAEKIALMHSELSEALEAERHGNGPSEHIAEYSGVEEELADLVIRIMDESVQGQFDVAGAVVAKMRFNDTRPFKHGKKF